MDELTAFITARLDEDEAGAWEIHHGSDCASCGPLQLSCDCGYPARTLREATAKRRTLERHRNCGTGVGYCDDGGHGWDDDAGGAMCNDKLDLAMPYSDHPDYRAEWAPSAT